MKLKDLIAVLKHPRVRGDLSQEISGMSASSASVRPGDLFLALPGERRDGADFAFEAVEKGAAALAAGRFIEGLAPRVPQVLLDDPPDQAALLANCFYGYPAEHLELVGVTGTNGKTTVAWLVRWILEQAGHPCGFLGTVRYLVGNRSLPAPLTTPFPPRLQELLAGMVRAGSTHAVMEASSHALAQGRLRGIGFRVGIFTNLTSDHLDYHGNLEAYGRAKSVLFKDLVSPDSGTAVLNRDDPAGQQLARRFAGRVLTYGMSGECDLRATAVRLSPEGISFLLEYGGESIPVTSRLLGRYNVANILAALGGLTALGLAPAEAVPLLAGVPPIPGRMEAVDGGHPFRILVDFAHTPDALENALVAVREITVGRLILVFGCGGDRDREKRPRMGEIAGRLADLTFITSDNPRSEEPGKIVAEIAAGFRGRFAALVLEPDRAAAINRAVAVAGPGDLVLIAGKGHEEKQVFADCEIPFSDRRVAAAALREAREKQG